MRSKHHPARVYGTVAALALLGGAVGLPAAAAAEVDPSPSPAPIAPHQLFIGQVNELTTGAVIKVGCFGPVIPGQTGHPLAGQTVDVVPAVSVPEAAQVGNTGDAANRVLVEFGGAPSVSTITSLSYYGVKAAIPTTLNLPCYGTGKVGFVPSPTSATARTSVILVTYQSIGV